MTGASEMCSKSAAGREAPDRESVSAPPSAERGRLLDLARLERLAFQPVEAIGAEQDEVDYQRQNEQEDGERHQGASRIE
jgi:hypothetical protein